jgi:hypothetical protein
MATTSECRYRWLRAANGLEAGSRHSDKEKFRSDLNRPNVGTALENITEIRRTSNLNTRSLRQLF